MARQHPIAVGTHVTQGFRPASNPTHDGVDFRAAAGTVLRAAIAGVIKTGSGHRKAGTWVEIHGADGTIAGYSHMSARDVVQGQHVNAGDIIGKSGATGNVTRPHLHFYVKRAGEFLNPVRWLAEELPAASSDKLPLKIGSRGKAVGKLQHGLREQFPGLAAHVTVKPGELLEEDEVFGDQTDAWVEAFQTLTGLSPDGVVGKFTVAELAEHSIKL